MGRIHIGKDVWTWEGYRGSIVIRDPQRKKYRFSENELAPDAASYDTVFTPANVRRLIENRILAKPDGIQCKTCYGRGGKKGVSGRFIKCKICGGTGRLEPKVVPKW